jgi:Outer membrane protein beta-barrel domain
MKKFVSMMAGALLLLVISQSNVVAQSDGVVKGDFLLSPFLGFGYIYAGGVTIGVTGEYAFTDEISGGGYLSYTRWDYGYTGSDIAYNFIDFGARASYHFAKLLKVPNKSFDPYAGAQLGFVSSKYDYDTPGYSDPYDGGVRAGLYAGARWFFNEKVGVYGEVGFALCPIMLGATFKL